MLANQSEQFSYVIQPIRAALMSANKSDQFSGQSTNQNRSLRS